jgi:hypothetical protein
MICLHVVMFSGFEGNWLGLGVWIVHSVVVGELVLRSETVRVYDWIG